MHTEEKKHDEHKGAHTTHGAHAGEHSTGHHGHEGAHETHHAKKALTIRISNKTAIAVAVGAVLILAALYGRSLIFAATVNGAPITRLEVMRGLEQTSGKAFVDTLVTEKLISAEAKSHGIVITDADVAKEMARIEKGLSAQGASMDMLLASQGLTPESLKKQIMIKQKLEQLLADKVTVTDAEVEAYIVQAKVTIPADKSAEARENIMEQLKGQKLNKEAGPYIDGLRTASSVVYYGAYKVPAEPVLPPQVK